jgi:type IV pilus biogenesis protein CpaD/CtpE
MQTQTRAPQQAPMAPPANPLSGLSDFMNSMVPPPRAQTVKVPVKIQKPAPREMKPPAVPNDISALLTSVGVEKKVVTTPKKASTGKNSVSIRL